MKDHREFRMTTGITLGKEAFDKVEHLAQVAHIARSRVIELFIEAVTQEQLAEFLIKKLSSKKD